MDQESNQNSIVQRSGAEDMDEIRKKNIAYEYLCHLEEAKTWLEAVLHEELPPTTEVEEGLRNGVFLAKLGHFIAPEIVPLSKIYDKDQKRYKIVGLQFRHTDNINYWLKALNVSGLPKTFHPETTDVYDKKDMPKVIYCIHALSTHLFKLGRASLIQDLFGKVNFTDAEITDMKRVLEQNATPVPAFRKIGGLLTNENAAGTEALNKALLDINSAVDEKDVEAVCQALVNPYMKIQYINASLLPFYCSKLYEAKMLKLEAALNRSLNESYVSDDFEETLTHAEIQGHITSVNVSYLCNEMMEAVEKGENLFTVLSNPLLRLRELHDENETFYMKEIAQIKPLIHESDASKLCNELQKIILSCNKKAKMENEVSEGMEKIKECLETGNSEQLWVLLRNPALNFNVYEFAVPLYFEELQADLEDNGVLIYEEVKAGLQTLNSIAAVNQAIDSGDPLKTWEMLSHPQAHFTNIDPAFKLQYWQSLTEIRHQKTRTKKCTLLTYFDIQDCIESVNQANENNNLLIQVLHSLNTAVGNKDEQAVMSALKNQALGLRNNICVTDAALYLKLLENCQIQKQKEDTELWLEDVQVVVKDVLGEIHEVQKVCANMAKINKALQEGDVDMTIETLLEGSFSHYSLKGHENKYFCALKSYRDRKTNCSSCPWIVHRTKKGNRAYLNMENFSYSWIKPEKFNMESKFLSRKDIEKILYKVNSGPILHINEKFVIRLQSYIRGYITRKLVREEFIHRKAIKIQAWWRGVLQRRKFSDMLNRYRHTRKSLQFDGILRHYRRHEEKIVKIQALWRGHQARQAFLSLFHKAKPSFKVVRQFAPYLSVNNDDYARELQLQNLKSKVVQTIRHNQHLAKQLDTMDVKIGLLVQNRITLQDVVAHNKNLNDLASRNTCHDTIGAKGLKSLNKVSRKRLEGYQHLFYMLQTSPKYLAKLLFCLPKDRTTRFIKTVIWALFNFGSNLREYFLLLMLFERALEEEVRVISFKEPSELISSMPLVLLMVADYARQAIGPNSLQSILGPLVEKVLGDKNLVINTNPVDIYRTWRNQLEMEQGRKSELPPTVSPDQALAFPEVQKRLTMSIQALKTYTLFFLDNITQSRDLIPYGLLYISRVLREALLEKFPLIPEKAVMKVVGNLIYYHYINPAIISPDSFGIITLTADRSLSSVERLNLASIAKILQFAAVKKGFGEESQYLMCLNSFIIDCHKKFKTFFSACCDVEDLEVHFSLHQYSEATLISRPVIYITLQEICDTHKLVVEYLDQIAPDPMDPLGELLEDMGPPPTLSTLTGTNPDNIPKSALGQTEVCLTLVNKFEVPDDDVTDVNKLFIKAKEILVCILPCLKGDNLLEALSLQETEEQKQLYCELIQERAEKQSHKQKMLYTTFSINEDSLQSCKNLLRQYLAKLELGGLVSQEDGYQNIITAIANDICNHGKYREIMKEEVNTLRTTKFSLDQKTTFYEEQVALYNQYIQKCLENLNAGKRNVHSLKNNTQRRKLKSKLVLKYTAARLHEKGILLEVDGLPASQFKNVQFEISPSDTNGIFTICGRFMGVDLEKVDIDIQHLLQLQFEGESVMDIFSKAKVNVNLLLFLLNKKFYGKA